MKSDDLTGKTFGWLTVMYKVEAKESKWMCKCICGKKTEAFASNLKRGHTTSCGCKRGTGIIGRRVGHLCVVEKIGGDEYKCICDCGKYCVRKYNSITQSRTMQCDECTKRIRKDAQSKCGEYVEGTQISKLKCEPTAANVSGVVGVNWDKSRGKWQAGIRFKGKKYNLGRFENFEDAVKARKRAEEEIFGNFLEWYEKHKKKGD